jgi:23S rRNA G2445 N2-methylase RlmL
LNAKITARDSKLEEAKETIKKAKVLVESKNAEVKTIKESNVRAKTMDELLSPLQEDKATVMQNLLENVQTSRLQHTFEKYLPAVLSNKSVGSGVKRKKALTESKKAITGNKETKELYQDSIDNIVDIKRLAGL